MRWWKGKTREGKVLPCCHASHVRPSLLGDSEDKRKDDTRVHFWLLYCCTADAPFRTDAFACLRPGRPFSFLFLCFVCRALRVRQSGAKPFVRAFLQREKEGIVVQSWMPVGCWARDRFRWSLWMPSAVRTKPRDKHVRHGERCLPLVGRLSATWGLVSPGKLLIPR